MHFQGVRRPCVYRMAMSVLHKASFAIYSGCEESGQGAENELPGHVSHICDLLSGLWYGEHGFS